MSSTAYTKILKVNEVNFIQLMLLFKEINFIYSYKPFLAECLTIQNHDRKAVRPINLWIL